jgi:hypothetical protein
VGEDKERLERECDAVLVIDIMRRKSSPTERLVRHKQVDSAQDGDDSLDVQAGLGRNSRGAEGKEEEG